MGKLTIEFEDWLMLSQNLEAAVIILEAKGFYALAEHIKQNIPVIIEATKESISKQNVDNIPTGTFKFLKGEY